MSKKTYKWKIKFEGIYGGGGGKEKGNAVILGKETRCDVIMPSSDN